MASSICFSRVEPILFCTIISLVLGLDNGTFYPQTISSRFVTDSTGDVTNADGFDSSRCHVWTTVEYTLTFSTFWSSQLFPKQYPTHRPRAQWSELLGRSHNDTYSLWRMGRRASREMRQFLLAGDVTGLVQADTQRSGGVLDMFNTRPLRAGVAMATASLFVDGQHTKLSAVSRLIPSPDWFVGVDSLDTCVNGDWLNETEVNLTLFDGGVDKGYVFTSPDFAEYPTKIIEQITASYPNHSASSFYYPNLDELPTIATLRLIKSRTLIDFVERNVVLSAKTLFSSNISENVASSLMQNDTLMFNSSHNNFNGTLNSSEFNNSLSWNGTTTTTSNYTETATESTTVEGSDCVLGEWSSWSPCPVTCGYGTTFRTKPVIRYPLTVINNSNLCSPLNETKTCGSMRGCRWSHFNSSVWSHGGTGFRGVG